MTPTQFRPELLERVELTLLHPFITSATLAKAVEICREFSLPAFAVTTDRLVEASHLLEGSGVKLVALIGHPFGLGDADAKRYEVELALDLGAQELEVAWAIAPIRDNWRARLLRQFQDILEAAQGNPVRFCLETPLLTMDEITVLGTMLSECGPQGLSTGTGFAGLEPASFDHLSSLRRQMPAAVELKLGGVGDLANVTPLSEGVADIIGWVPPFPNFQG